MAKKHPNETTSKFVIEKTKIGISEKELAGILGIDPKTLRAHYGNELLLGLGAYGTLARQAAMANLQSDKPDPSLIKFVEERVNGLSPAASNINITSYSSEDMEKALNNNLFLIDKDQESIEDDADSDD